MRYLAERLSGARTRSRHTRGKGTKKPKILLAVQRSGEASAMVIPEESAADIAAALNPIVAPGAFLVSDKQNSFAAAAS